LSIPGAFNVVVEPIILVPDLESGACSVENIPRFDDILFDQDPSGLECLDSFDSVWQEDEQVESARRARLEGTAMTSSGGRQLRRWTINCSQ